MAKKIYAAFTQPKPISELEITTSLEPGNMLLETVDGTAKMISTEVFYQLLHKIAVPITPADAGPFTANTWYKPMVYSAGAGTNYPNAGDQKAIEGFDTLFFYTGTGWQKYSNKLPQAKIDTWSAVSYSAGKQVFHEGKIYESSDAVVSTDVPGVSSKWLKKTEGSALASDDDFKNKLSSKAVTPEQFFSVIGDYQFSGQIIPLSQKLPHAGFTLESCNSPLPAGSYWTYADSMYSDFEKITAVDLKITQGTYNLYVFQKTDYNTPSQVISITAATTGVQRHVFNPPLNPATHKVFISGGFFYNGITTIGVQNIANGALNNNPNVAIGMLLIGSKTVVSDSNTIMSMINSSQKKFSNYLYHKKGISISNISADAGGGTYNINENGLTLNSAGVNKGVTLDKQINLNKRYLELRMKLNSDNIFYVGTKNVENQVGENYVEIDCIAKTLKVKAVFGGSDVVKAFDFNIVNGREYIVRYYKLDEIDRLELIDTVTAKFEYVEKIMLGQFDKYKFGLIAGSPVIVSEISVISILKDRPYLGFYGDSITEGNSVGSASKTPYYHDRFANLIGEKTGKSYYVSGRSAGEITGVLARMQTELPSLLPYYVFVTIGTNGTPTAAQYNNLVDYCESLGVKVILNLIPLHNGTTDSKNTIIEQVVTTRNLLCVKTNVATSINGDGVTKDSSLFADEGGLYIHPNEAGNIAIYKRALIDIKSIFVEAGIF